MTTVPLCRKQPITDDDVVHGSGAVHLIRLHCHRSNNWPVEKCLLTLDWRKPPELRPLQRQNMFLAMAAHECHCKHLTVLSRRRFQCIVVDDAAESTGRHCKFRFVQCHSANGTAKDYYKQAVMVVLRRRPNNMWPVLNNELNWPLDVGGVECHSPETIYSIY